MKYRAVLTVEYEVLEEKDGEEIAREIDEKFDVYAADALDGRYVSTLQHGPVPDDLT